MRRDSYRCEKRTLLEAQTGPCAPLLVRRCAHCSVPTVNDVLISHTLLDGGTLYSGKQHDKGPCVISPLLLGSIINKVVAPMIECCSLPGGHPMCFIGTLITKSYSDPAYSSVKVLRWLAVTNAGISISDRHVVTCFGLVVWCAQLPRGL